MKKKLVVLAGVATAALALAAQPALAVEIQLPPTGHDTITCRLSAVAGNLEPAIAPLLAPWPEQQATGSYQMAADGTCVKADADSGETANSNVYSVHLNSSGTYFSSFCGSLLTLYGGSPASLDSQQPGWQGPVLLTYRLDFAGVPGTLASAGAMVVLTAGNVERTTGIAGSGVAGAVPYGSSCLGDGISAIGMDIAFQAVI